MAPTDHEHLCPGHYADPGEVTIDRWTLEDAAAWLGHIEDWLLHADPDHVTAFAGFLDHRRAGRVDLVGAALVRDIGSTAATLHRLLILHPEPKRTS